MKIQKKKKFGGGGGSAGQWGGGVGVKLGGQSGRERRIEVFVKIQKKNLRWGRRGRGRVWGVRVDVIEELKSFWENSHKKNFRGGGGQGGCE